MAASITRVASSATSVDFLAARGSRRKVIVYNASTAILYIKFGATADIAGGDESYTQVIAANTQAEILGSDLYSGEMDAIWAAANGYAMITEIYGD